MSQGGEDESMGSKMITIGLTNMHGMIQEAAQFPPKGITYKPLREITNPLLKHPFKHYESRDVDLVEAYIFPCITKNKWIYVCSHASCFTTFTIFDEYFSRSTRLEIIKKLLVKNNFKKLIFLSFAALKTLKTYARIKEEEILRKTTVVYPAIREINAGELTRKVKREKIHILFVGMDFIRKGGSQLIDAFERLQKQFDNIELTIASWFHEIDSTFDPCDRKKVLYNRINKNPGIIYLNRITRGALFEQYYPNADIYILPTLNDVFGFSLLEAFAFGLPVIATNIHAIPEIVENNSSGLLINIKNHKFYKDRNRYKNNNDKYIVPKSLDEQLTEEIYEKLKRLIEDFSLRKKLGKNALRVARTKFSFEKRNRIMSRIYREATEA